MLNYLGTDCPVCGKKFVEGDDVVVCPTCGAPHHRDCYHEIGHCARNDLHLSGKDWQSPLPLLSDNSALCPGCGFKNQPDSEFCESCGKRLKEAHAAPTPEPAHSAYAKVLDGTNAALADGMTTHDSVKGIPIKDLILFIGPNSVYFVNRFIMQIRGKGLFNVNFGALFFSCFYFFYRKMYKMGAVLFSIIALSFLPTMILTCELSSQLIAAHPELFSVGVAALPSYSELYTLFQNFQFDYTGLSTLLALARTLTNVPLFVSLFACFYANRSYLSHSLHKVVEIRQTVDTSNQFAYTTTLIRKGGISVISTLLLIIGMVAFYFVGLFIITMIVL